MTVAKEGMAPRSGAPIALVIDDDADERHAVSEIVAQCGFHVHHATNGHEGLEAAMELRPELITIDVNMPGMDGFETLRRLREMTTAYAVMISELAEEAAVVEALRGGADDYVIKPFRPFELRARIGALLRRPRAQRVLVRPDAQGILVHGELRVDGLIGDAQAAGRNLGLTRSEFLILSTLVRHRGQVLSKETLALSTRDSATGIATVHDRHAVEVHIMNLRRKLNDDPRNPQHIQTVRGVGYRFVG